MKTIGLIGGLSWESTVTYYQIMNTIMKEQLGGLHSAKCILYSVDFAELEKCLPENDWDTIAAILSDAARRLERAGAQNIVLCTNTMHKAAPQIQAAVTVPMLHIADATAMALQEKNIKKAILLGTQYTMEQDFIKQPLIKNGIDILIPDPAERTEINRIIFEELCVGNIVESSAGYLLHVIDRMSQEGGEGVILGCTELGLIIKEGTSPIPAFDTAVIHATQAAHWALAD